MGQRAPIRSTIVPEPHGSTPECKNVTVVLEHGAGCNSFTWRLGQASFRHAYTLVRFAFCTCYENGLTVFFERAEKYKAWIRT
jgi:nitrogenase molybdenum-iron protein alpha/beta subunit